MKNKKESFFWTSYSDLMTSLFFIMLVLFVLVIALLHSRLKATQEELNQIKQLNESVKQIDTQYFEYDSVYNRHTLKNINVSFPARVFSMESVPSDQQQRLLNTGKAILNFLQYAKDSLPKAEYLVIIEGQSSNDNYGTMNDGSGNWKKGSECKNNDVLSYQRAFSLVQFWKNSGIQFDSLPCEIIISGSGTHSKFREQPDNALNDKNQRFVVHIIAKPDLHKEKE